MRALRVFQVTRRGITVRVRVLPGVREVTQAWCKKSAASGRTWSLALDDGLEVHGFTIARAGGGHAEITLPLAGWTPGLVAHEVVHAATSFGHRNSGDDEPMAYFVGDMVDSICARLRKLEAAR